MQGRLSPSIDGKIQSFPIDTWQKEFETAKQLGFRGIEWTVDFKTFYQHPLLRNDYSDFLRSVDSSFYINTVTCDFFMQLEPWSSRFGLNEAFHLLSLLAEKGSRINDFLMVVPLVDSGAPQTQADWAKLHEYLSKLTETLAQNGARIAFEFEIEPFQQNAFINSLNIDYYGINFDSGNSASLGFKPFEELSIIYPHLFNVHLKDRVLGGGTVPFGDGDTNFDEIVRFFTLNLYVGHFVIQGARIDKQSDFKTASCYLDFCIKKGFS